MKKTAVLIVLVLVAGCGNDPPPAPPKVVEEPSKTPVKVTPGKAPLAPPLTDVQKKAVEATFLEARKLVKQAREFKSAGEAIEKTQGRQAANDTLVKAKKLFKEAAANTEDWIEPDLGKVTEGQVKDYLQSYNNERAAWLKDISSLGKLHDDN